MIGAFLRTSHAREATARARAVIADLPALCPTRRRTASARPGASAWRSPARSRHEPKLLLLDEAMAGLTPAEVARAIELIRTIHASGITLVIVEHIMEVIMSLATRVIVLHQGREIAQGSPSGNHARRKGDRGLFGQTRRIPQRPA